MIKSYAQRDLSNKYFLLGKIGQMKRRDINYIINSHTKQGGCKEISFLEKVNSEEEPRYKNKIMNKTRIGADENTYLLFIKSRPKKSRDIKYIIKSYAQRGLSNK